MSTTKTIESAFTRDYPDADCYREVAAGKPQVQRHGIFCSCAAGYCAKTEAEQK
jgi:hypothetical protein